MDETLASSFKIELEMVLHTVGNNPQQQGNELEYLKEPFWSLTSSHSHTIFLWGLRVKVFWMHNNDS